MMIEEGIWEAKTKKKEEPPEPTAEKEPRAGADRWFKACLAGRTGPKATLLVFVDDATSEILAAEFVPEECFFSYGDLLQTVFQSTWTSQVIL